MHVNTWRNNEKGKTKEEFWENSATYICNPGSGDVMFSDTGEWWEWHKRIQSIENVEPQMRLVTILSITGKERSVSNVWFKFRSTHAYPWQSNGSKKFFKYL